MKLHKLIIACGFSAFLLPLNAFAQEDFDERELEKPIEFPGSVPRENPIMQARFQQIDFEKADQLYHENVENAADSEYKGNLQVWGFLLVMKNGLLEKGSNIQKEYYIRQQLKAKNSLPNIKQFYELLRNASDFMEREELLEISAAFVDKNEASIEALQWQTEEAKKAKTQELYLAARKFGRHLERERLLDKG